MKKSFSSVCKRVETLESPLLPDRSTASNHHTQRRRRRGKKVYNTYFHFFARIQWIKILCYFFFLYYFVCRLFFLLHTSSTDSIFSTVHSFQSNICAYCRFTKMKNVQQTLKQSSLITDNSFSLEIRFSIDFQSLVNFSLFFSVFSFWIYTILLLYIIRWFHTFESVSLNSATLEFCVGNDRWSPGCCELSNPKRSYRGLSINL